MKNRLVILFACLGALAACSPVEQEQPTPAPEGLVEGMRCPICPMAVGQKAAQSHTAYKDTTTGIIMCPPCDGGGMCGDGYCDPYSEDSYSCPYDCGGGGVCGDGVCNGSDTTANCPGDCGTLCGDGACNGGEGSYNCANDCGSVCGDGVCNGGESGANCSADCGGFCGDSVCNGNENTTNCDHDCGTICGDGACNGGETTSNCSTDCGSGGWCGDGFCDAYNGENSYNCSYDCGGGGGGFCGDGLCEFHERNTCRLDCGRTTCLVEPCPIEPI
jgi:hypothetical protein